jgi:site-specific DNA-methyltransferase (adenine-specific)
VKRYTVILADPAWRYSDKRPGHGGAERHFTTMTAEQIRALPVASISAADAALFLWATSPMLRVGLSVIRAWGFEFITEAFTWVKRGREDEFGRPGKLVFGNGSWTRANVEHVLLGIRGRPFRVHKGVHQVVEAPRGEHSAKPPEVRRRIEQLFGDVPRVELFAREAVPGWDRFGDEAPRGRGLIELVEKHG